MAIVWYSHFFLLLLFSFFFFFFFFVFYYYFVLTYDITDQRQVCAAVEVFSCNGNEIQTKHGHKLATTSMYVVSFRKHNFVLKGKFICSKRLITKFHMGSATLSNYYYITPNKGKKSE
jgi:hypothetical protein